VTFSLNRELVGLRRSEYARLVDALEEDQGWTDYFAKFAQSRNAMHLAVMVEPYLSYLLEGKKTIESRFSIHKRAPYNRVRKDDVILVKRPGGPIVGICLVSNVWFYELDQASWKKIWTDFFQKIFVADPEFWFERQHASYATLILIKNARTIRPFRYAKKDRRGWVVLRPHKDQLGLDTKLERA